MKLKGVDAFISGVLQLVSNYLNKTMIKKQHSIKPKTLIKNANLFESIWR